MCWEKQPRIRCGRAVRVGTPDLTPEMVLAGKRRYGTLPYFGTSAFRRIRTQTYHLKPWPQAVQNCMRLDGATAHDVHHSKTISDPRNQEFRCRHSYVYLSAASDSRGVRSLRTGGIYAPPYDYYVRLVRNCRRKRTLCPYRPTGGVLQGGTAFSRQFAALKGYRDKWVYQQGKNVRCRFEIVKCSLKTGVAPLMLRHSA